MIAGRPVSGALGTSAVIPSAPRRNRFASHPTTIAKAKATLMWGLHLAEVSIEPIKAFLYYRLSGRKMPRVERYVALIRTRHTQESKQRILR
jgi:hypothetical protein